jgi:hypothetical protein
MNPGLEELAQEVARLRERTASVFSSTWRGRVQLAHHGHSELDGGIEKIGARC